ncbi:MAG: nodulation protein NfeD [Pseudomonadota bacterium]|nr:MAG: peptidase S14 [Pseudomonadota bacterium]
MSEMVDIRTKDRRVLLPVMAAVLVCAAGGGAQEGALHTVALCELTGTVDSGMAAYLADCVRIAAERRYEALVVRVDTPGGALEATRDIVREFLGSPVPVLVWVGPSGARAGSAGVFVTLAANVAAMAPGTNIGAAHPVMGPSGQDPEVGGQHMAEKVVNDTAAFAEAIARQRGRNVDWAVEAVRESASVPDDRAVALGVVDLIATSVEDLLDKVDGRTVKLPGGERILVTRGARVERLNPTMRQAFVHWLANPAIAYILLLVGGLGLAIELANPGAIVPGLVGGVSFVLALLSLSALPIQAGGVLLLLAGLGMIVAEFFVASGLLGAAGVGLLILGGFLLVDRFDPEWFVEPTFAVSWEFLLPIALILGGGAVYLLVRAAQTRNLQHQVGDLGLIGKKGRALSPIDSRSGTVFVFGERWNARSEQPIAEGEDVVVRRVEGLTLYVEKAS